VICSIEERVALVTLNRPERLNAMGNEMGRQFDRIMVRIAQDEDIRAVVLTGAGRGSAPALIWSDSSASLKARRALRTCRNPGRRKERTGLSSATRRRSFDPLLRPAGSAAAGDRGGEWTLRRHRLGDRSTKRRSLCQRRGVLRSPLCKARLVAEVGLAAGLAALVGAGAAADMLLSGRRVLADEALHMGLVEQVKTPERLLATPSNTPTTSSAMSRRARPGSSSGSCGRLAPSRLLMPWGSPWPRPRPAC